MNRWLNILALIGIILLVALCVYGQPIMPVATYVDTNEVSVPQLATATLSWDKHTNATQYRWTNWNAWTNQGGTTTGTNVSVIMVLGTNWAGVRAEKGTNVSSWGMITNKAAATNAVGIVGMETRTMAFNGATWGPWLVTTQVWYSTTVFQKQWRPIIVNSNWWKLQ